MGGGGGGEGGRGERGGGDVRGGRPFLQPQRSLMCQYAIYIKYNRL